MDSVVIEKFEKIKHEDDFYTVYHLKCKTKDGKEYVLQKRYKQLETYYLQLQFQLIWKNQVLPKFPPKFLDKDLNLKDEFLKKRMYELNQFLEAIMKNKVIKNHSLTLYFFKEESSLDTKVDLNIEKDQKSKKKK